MLDAEMRLSREAITENLSDDALKQRIERLSVEVASDDHADIPQQQPEAKRKQKLQTDIGTVDDDRYSHLQSPEDF
jgi:hypothetical protein